MKSSLYFIDNLSEKSRIYKIKNILFLSFFLFFPSLLFAQTLKISIQEKNLKIDNNDIFQNGKIYKKNAKSLEIIPVKSGDEILIKNNLYQEYSFKISKNLKISDTIYKIIQLQPKIQEYDEITISASKYEVFYKEKNEFIIDYFPNLNEEFFLLTKIKNSYFLKWIDKLGENRMEIPLNFKPELFFQDAIGNFHVVSNDSVYQIYQYEKSCKLLSPISMEVFKREIEPLITLTSEGGFYKKLSFRNQKFSIYRIKKEEEPQEVFSTFDSFRYEHSMYSYNKVIQLYNLIMPDELNIIKMGIWDGDLMTLNDYPYADLSEIQIPDNWKNEKIAWATNWSKNIADLPLNVHAFARNNKLIILNGVDSSLIKMNLFPPYESKTISAGFELTGDYFFDFSTKNLYLFADEQGNTYLYKINSEENKTEQLIVLDEIRQPRSIKIRNDKVYFLLLEESGYNRLMRVK